MKMMKCDHPNCDKMLAVEAVENCNVRNCEQHQPYPTYGRMKFHSAECRQDYVRWEDMSYGLASPAPRFIS